MTRMTRVYDSVSEFYPKVKAMTTAWKVCAHRNRDISRRFPVAIDRSRLATAGIDQVPTRARIAARMNPWFIHRERSITMTQQESKSNNEIWELRLYVAGQTARSAAALANLKQVCEDHLSGRYRIEVIDLLKDPQLARGDQIVATPTVVRKRPEPIRRIVGDLSNADRVRLGLQLSPNKSVQEPR